MIQGSLAQGITRFIPGPTLFNGLDTAIHCIELIVAVTVFAVSIAYSDLAAGVTLLAVLYVALGVMVISPLFGISRQPVTGPEATTAILAATAVAPLAGGYLLHCAAPARLVGLLSILDGHLKPGFIVGNIHLSRLNHGGQSISCSASGVTSLMRPLATEM